MATTNDSHELQIYKDLIEQLRKEISSKIYELNEKNNEIDRLINGNAENQEAM